MFEILKLDMTKIRRHLAELSPVLAPCLEIIDSPLCIVR
jgi:hypothetical protein